MKTILKLLAWITGITLFLFILAIGGFWLFLYTTADDMCGNKIIKNIELEEDQIKAVVFQRDCGATTGFSTQVSLINNKETLPNESGNVFIADTDHGIAPKGEGGGPEVQVKVISSNHIRILTHQNARIFKNEPYWNDIIISYEKL